MRKLLPLALLLIVNQQIILNAQEQIDIKPASASMGLGAGTDFGGIGGIFTFFPSKTIALFVGAGYNML